MALTEQAERAFNSTSVSVRPVQLLTLTHDSFGALRICDDNVPFTSRGNEYTPAPFLGVRLAPSVPNEVPAVEMSFGLNDQSIVASLRSVDESPRLTLEVVTSAEPDDVQDSTTDLEMQKVDLGILQVRIELAVFTLFQTVGPKRGYTPDIAPGAFR